MRRATTFVCLLACFGCRADGPAAFERCPPAGEAARPLPVAAKPAPDATRYFVRPDGGDANQCSGRVDAPYQEGGNRDCAWNSPAIALPSSGSPRIGPGDVLVLAAGTYTIGAPLQAVPSGPAPDKPTRVIGKSGTMPRLVGTHGIDHVLSLDGSSNIEIGRLEITDGSECIYRHPGPGVACTDATPRARTGIYARASRNAWLHDLDIHGLAALGINAGGLRDWTLDRIRINRNGRAGWDGNIGPDGSNAGAIVIRDIEVGWNGCGERVATGEPVACWAQQAGGYGDGFGTTKTGGQWLIEDGYFHHNTSDGLDLRYMDGADDTKVVLRRIHSRANAGNQVKVKGNSLVENSVLVGHCSFFANKFFMEDKDLCRADGSTLQLVLTGDDVATVRGNTIAGEGAVQIGHSEGDTSDRVVVHDNLVVGFPYFRDPDSLSGFNGGKSPADKQFRRNVAWNVRKCPGDTDCGGKPKLANTTLAAFDANPLPGSASAGRAGAVSCPGRAPTGAPRAR